MPQNDVKSVTSSSAASPPLSPATVLRSDDATAAASGDNDITLKHPQTPEVTKKVLMTSSASTSSDESGIGSQKDVAGVMTSVSSNDVTNEPGTTQETIAKPSVVTSFSADETEKPSADAAAAAADEMQALDILDQVLEDEEESAHEQDEEEAETDENVKENKTATSGATDAVPSQIPTTPAEAPPSSGEDVKTSEAAVKKPLGGAGAVLRRKRDAQEVCDVITICLFLTPYCAVRLYSPSYL